MAGILWPRRCLSWRLKDHRSKCERVPVVTLPLSDWISIWAPWSLEKRIKGEGVTVLQFKETSLFKSQATYLNPKWHFMLQMLHDFGTTCDLRENFVQITWWILVKKKITRKHSTLKFLSKNCEKTRQNTTRCFFTYKYRQENSSNNNALIFHLQKPTRKFVKSQRVEFGFAQDAKNLVSNLWFHNYLFPKYPKPIVKWWQGYFQIRISNSLLAN